MTPQSLFNSRSGLKPVREFNDLLAKALPAGRCECDRCRAGNYDQTSYQFKHSVEIDGVVHCRIFAISSQESFDQAITGAWESYYQADRPASHVLDVDAVLAFTDPDKTALLQALLVMIHYPPGLVGR